MPVTATKSKSVLVVDDSVLIVERLVEMLKEVESVKQLFTAENYHEAVGVLSQRKPDLVLLDIHMPGKNGIDLLRFISSEYPETKVLMISNQVSEHYQRLCKQEGAIGFIDKSKDFDQIPQFVEEL